MDSPGIVSHYNNLILNDPNMSATVAAIETLLEVMEQSKVGTLLELFKILDDARQTIISAPTATASVSSGCELFIRFITRCSAKLESHLNVQECKDVLLRRGKIFLKESRVSRDKIAKYAKTFIIEGTRVLVHSYSRVVVSALRQHQKEHTVGGYGEFVSGGYDSTFQVYITESLPDRSGIKMYNELTKLNISCTLIRDAAIGSIMSTIDFVFLGAESVVESGGIINKIGSYAIALCAKAHSKPVYVLAESYKFLRYFPLNGADLPEGYKAVRCSMEAEEEKRKRSGCSSEVWSEPLVDYTPPQYITLLFTDIGTLTPSAVSDELIKLYI